MVGRTVSRASLTAQPQQKQIIINAGHPAAFRRQYRNVVGYKTHGRGQIRLAEGNHHNGAEEGKGTPRLLRSRENSSIGPSIITKESCGGRYRSGKRVSLRAPGGGEGKGCAAGNPGKKRKSIKVLVHAKNPVATDKILRTPYWNDDEMFLLSFT